MGCCFFYYHIIHFDFPLDIYTRSYLNTIDFRMGIICYKHLNIKISITHWKKIADSRPFFCFPFQNDVPNRFYIIHSFYRFYCGIFLLKTRAFFMPPSSLAVSKTIFSVKVCSRARLLFVSI